MVGARRDGVMLKGFGYRLERLSPARLSLALAGVFAASHVVYYLLGIRFDGTPLLWYWQYLDPELLRNKLWESVFYLHSQPPLFNLFMGIILKVSRGDGRAIFQGFYLATGLTLYLSLFWLQLRLGVSRGVAVGLSTLFLLSPSFILYEHFLFYTFLLAALITLSALLFYEVLVRRRTWAVAAFFLSIFLICGIRHVFHIAYYLLAAAFLAAACAGARRKVLLAAAVPFLVLFSFYAKNFVLFGQFSASSWTGMNFWQMTGTNLTLRERELLLAEGRPSEAALVPPFSAVRDYPAGCADVSRFPDVEALTQAYKSTGPHNYNHLAYVAASREYLNDSLYVMKRFPEAYFRGLLRSWFIYFKSSSDHVSGVRFLDETGNLRRISFLNDVYDYAFFGRVFIRPLSRGISSIFLFKGEEKVYLFLWLGLPVLLFYGFGLALRRGGPGARGLERDQRLTVLYICLNILYVALVSNMFSWAENNRMRFPTDPLYVALLGLFIQRVLLGRRRLSGRFRSSSDGPSTSAAGR